MQASVLDLCRECVCKVLGASAERVMRVLYLGISFSDRGRNGIRQSDGRDNYD